MSFSKNLEVLMKRDAVTSYRLAKEIGVHATTVKNWKCGTQPLLEHAKKVAEFFDVNLCSLIS